LDGEDMTFERIVQVVNHRGLCRGLSGASWPGHEYQTLFLIAELSQNRRHAQLFERNDLGRDVAEDRAGPSGLQEDVDAETGDVTHLKGKIAFVVLFKDLTMVVAHHVIDQGVDL